jgi:hypothetical protein
MKTKKCFRMAAILIALAFAFFGCSSDDNGNGGGDDGGNPLVGTWTLDGSNGMVVVTVTANAWTAKVNNSTYNSGTYTYDGGSSFSLTITDKGIGSLDAGATGKATIISSGMDKMAITEFSDSSMNGNYSKQ